VVRRCVLSRNLVNEEALAHWGMLRQKQTNFEDPFYMTTYMNFWKLVQY